MRDFICGRESLISCGFEMFGFLLLTLFLAAAALFGIFFWWQERKTK